jgi:hypothetical protein
MKKLLTLLVLFAVIPCAQSQDRKLEFSPTTGLVMAYEEPGSGFEELGYGVHFGVNIYSKRPKRLKTDLQISMNFTGKAIGTGSILSVNALYGGRFYLTRPEQRTKVFVNALAGGAFIGESGDDFTENRFDLGYSLGSFVLIKRMLLGVSAESYNNVILKIGYTF